MIRSSPVSIPLVSECLVASICALVKRPNRAIRDLTLWDGQFRMPHIHRIAVGERPSLRKRVTAITSGQPMYWTMSHEKSCDMIVYVAVQYISMPRSCTH